MNFDMGAYGVYIWPAYGISALAILGAIVWTLAAWRRARAKLAALEKNDVKNDVKNDAKEMTRKT